MGTFVRRTIGPALPTAREPQGLEAIDGEAADLHEAGVDLGVDAEKTA
jgi:hypothetical protein